MNPLKERVYNCHNQWGWNGFGVMDMIGRYTANDYVLGRIKFYKLSFCSEPTVYDLSMCLVYKRIIIITKICR